jgi:hypothetical protein
VVNESFSTREWQRAAERATAFTSFDVHIDLTTAYDFPARVESAGTLANYGFKLDGLTLTRIDVNLFGPPSGLEPSWITSSKITLADGFRSSSTSEYFTVPAIQPGGATYEPITSDQERSFWEAIDRWLALVALNQIQWEALKSFATELTRTVMRRANCQMLAIEYTPQRVAIKKIPSPKATDEDHLTALAA